LDKLTLTPILTGSNSDLCNEEIGIGMGMGQDIMVATCECK